MHQNTLHRNEARVLSIQIAEAIRDAIVAGRIDIDERLPSEAELALQFGVSRPTVREALKRLAAQSLIRTRRGATGGAFVNRLTYEDAQGLQITTSTLLLSMNAVAFEAALEARIALETACAPHAAERCGPAHFSQMRAALNDQGDPLQSDEAFCASDVAFHRAYVNSAGNPILSYHLAGAVEAMQPLMNMITFSARDRKRMIGLHDDMVEALQARHTGGVVDALKAIGAYTQELFDVTRVARAGAVPG